MQINRLPPEVVKYFTDPNAVEPPDMQLLLPFVESALPLAYGVLGVQLFHVRGVLSFCSFGSVKVFRGDKNIPCVLEISYFGPHAEIITCTSFVIIYYHNIISLKLIKPASI